MGPEELVLVGGEFCPGMIMGSFKYLKYKLSFFFFLNFFSELMAMSTFFWLCRKYFCLRFCREINGGPRSTHVTRPHSLHSIACVARTNIFVFFCPKKKKNAALAKFWRIQILSSYVISLSIPSFLHILS